MAAWKHIETRLAPLNWCWPIVVARYSGCWRGHVLTNQLAPSIRSTMAASTVVCRATGWRHVVYKMTSRSWIAYNRRRWTITDMETVNTTTMAHLYAVWLIACLPALAMRSLFDLRQWYAGGRLLGNGFSIPTLSDVCYCYRFLAVNFFFWQWRTPRTLHSHSGLFNTSSCRSSPSAPNWCYSLTQDDFC